MCIHPVYLQRVLKNTHFGLQWFFETTAQIEENFKTIPSYLVYFPLLVLRPKTYFFVIKVDKSKSVFYAPVILKDLVKIKLQQIYKNL